MLRCGLGALGRSPAACAPSARRRCGRRSCPAANPRARPPGRKQIAANTQGRLAACSCSLVLACLIGEIGHPECVWQGLPICMNLAAFIASQKAGGYAGLPPAAWSHIGRWQEPAAATVLCKSSLHGRVIAFGQTISAPVF